jgi:hypothetical protein
MPVSVVFECEICGARPDPETQGALERQLLDLRHGEYLDAEPGRRLTWHGRGMYRPQRYACGAHRGRSHPLWVAVFPREPKTHGPASSDYKSINFSARGNTADFMGTNASRGNSISQKGVTGVTST